MRLPLLLLLLSLAAAAPVIRQQTVPPPVSDPDAELVPGGPSPTPLPPSQPPTSTPPQPSSLPPVSPSPPVTTASPVATASTPPITPPTATPPVPTASATATATSSPAAGAIPVSGNSSRLAPILAGSLAGGLAVLLLLLCCCFACLRRRHQAKSSDAATGVYTSTAAGVETEPAAGQEPDYTNMDDARKGDRGIGGGGIVETRDVGGDGDGGDDAVPIAPLPALVPLVIPVKRGVSPPPHDYVLGAGPAETRSHFVHLRTKFERDEIGDNSAVLGVERSGVVAEGLERDMTRSPNAAVTGTAVGSHAHESELADLAVLPDRDVPHTFDSQERLMAGGDGSGAISDAAMSWAASIAEESGDVPSLERDPIARNEF